MTYLLVIFIMMNSSPTGEVIVVEQDKTSYRTHTDCREAGVDRIGAVKAAPSTAGRQVGFLCTKTQS